MPSFIAADTIAASYPAPRSLRSVHHTSQFIKFDSDVQSDRIQRVQALAVEHALERSHRYLGREVEVLVEDRNPKNGGEVMGRTRQGRQVFFQCKQVKRRVGNG
jgi:tRNA A37 methylthiotransferase MiaB